MYTLMFGFTQDGLLSRVLLWYTVMPLKMNIKIELGTRNSAGEMFSKHQRFVENCNIQEI